MDTTEMEKQRKIIEQINAMTREDMCRLWRNAPAGHPFFDTRLPYYAHFEKRFNKLGRFSPEISKQIDREVYEGG